MTNETTNVPEAIYVLPTVLCRASLTREEIKIELATVESKGVRALCVFRNEEDAIEWRSEAHHLDESMKPIPVEDEQLRDLLEIYKCGHVVTPISFLGDGSVDLYPAEDFMEILEEGVPA